MQRTTSFATTQHVSVVGIEHTWILGNAERAEGSWRASYTQFAELYDTKADRLRRTEHALPPTAVIAPERATVLTDSVAGVFVNGKLVTGSRGLFEDLIDRVQGSPLRALELAAASTGLTYDRRVARFGIMQDVVSFPWRNGRMRLELSTMTHLPNASRSCAHIRTTFGGRRSAM